MNRAFGIIVALSVGAVLTLMLSGCGAYHVAKCWTVCRFEQECCAG